MGHYYEDFAVGQVWRTHGRTIGEGDITLFAGLSGDFTPIHMDAHKAKQGPFGGRIAHGTLSLSIATGLMTHLRLFEGLRHRVAQTELGFPRCCAHRRYDPRRSERD